MRRDLLIPGLSVSLLVSWGSLYYAFTVLAKPMQLDLQLSEDVLVGAFSTGLLVWGIATYPIGFALDRWGAQKLMTLGALIAVVGFLGLYAVSSVWAFYIFWSLLGLAMAMTLYEPAFAWVVQSSSEGHRRRIGWLTIAGGLASTVFWPLSHYMSESFGWRCTVLIFAAMHFLIFLGLQCICAPSVLPLKAPYKPKNKKSYGAWPQSGYRSASAQLSICFAIYGFITASIAVQAISMLESRGLDAATALHFASFIGPMQVISRTIDTLVGGRLGVRHLGLITLGFMTLSLIALWLAQWLPSLSIIFVISYGLALGMLTIVRATAPLELSGVTRYASNNSIIGAPSLIARAAGPLGAALLLKEFGDYNDVLIILLLASLIGIWLYMRAWSR